MTTEPHKWTSFEVRTLVCLIIKGEHRVSHPMDLADKLNTALYPPRQRGGGGGGGGGGDFSDGSSTLADYDRDIPVADVEAMLARILAGKKHAVDLCARDPSSSLVTKKKISAFARSLDFDGGDEEWRAGGRGEKVAAAAAERAERARARATRERRGAGGPREEVVEDGVEKDRRLKMIGSPRAHRLLVDWGMGASFWEDKVGHIAEEASSTDSEEAVPPTQGQNLTATPSSNTTIKNNSDDPFVVPDSRVLEIPAGSLCGSLTPAWMRPVTTPRPNDPPSPIGVTVFGGGFGGSFTPAAYRVEDGTATPDDKEQQPYHTPAYNGFGGGSSAPAPAPAPPAPSRQQQRQPPPACHAYNGGCLSVGAYSTNNNNNTEESNSGDNLQRQRFRATALGRQADRQGGYGRDGRY